MQCSSIYEDNDAARARGPFDSEKGSCKILGFLDNQIILWLNCSIWSRCQVREVADDKVLQDIELRFEYVAVHIDLI